jgi:biphenyl-2,3-diol 1,2-dioxygenase
MLNSIETFPETPVHTSFRLAYLALNVRSLDRWRAFARDMLGLVPAGANADGSEGFRLDAAAQRLILVPGRADDLEALGFEVADADALGQLAQQLRAAGVQAAWGKADDLAARRVGALLALCDPEGNRIELVSGVQAAPTPLDTEHAESFSSDDSGFGHAVLVARDLARLERFYVDALGFRVSERLATKVGPIHVRGVFLHCNRRHHSLALMALPHGKHLHHFMLEVGSVTEVVRAYDRARRLRVPLSLDLGQHPAPDGTVSFYGRTPSGFDFEVGAGGAQINPEGWRPSEQTITSSWGHRPTLGLQLRAVRDLVASRVSL